MSVSDTKVNPDGSILWFWYDKTNEYNKSQTNSNHRTAIRAFERWLASQAKFDHECHWTDIDLDDVSRDQMLSPRNIDEKDAETYLKDLTEAFQAKTQRTYIDTLTSAYAWLTVKCVDECVSADPFNYVLSIEGKDILDTPSGRTAYIVDLEDVRYIIEDWDDIKWSCVNQITAKYSRRAGGISNLDFQDLHISHPGCDWHTHPKLRHWDDHILFRPDKSESDAGRKSGNKTSATAKYPIDNELKQSLLCYLAARTEPDDPTDPLFLDSKFTRLSATSMSNKFRRKAKEITRRDEGPKCWYEANDDDNINVHYYRHWSTTWYQDRTGDQSLVDYLRGDTGEGSSANYDQYTDVKEQKILDAMPTFFGQEHNGPRTRPERSGNKHQ